METRANYVIVGLFTIAAILAAFGFVYWTAGGDRGETATLRIRIPGSASGLARGSSVNFNGVKVGDVRQVYIDLENPSAAIADAEVDRNTPITQSTTADIGIAGLTGTANIELKGGDLKETKLLDQAAAEGRVAEITADPSAVTNLLQTAQDIFERADNVIVQLEGFAVEVRGPLAQTAVNAKEFSDALAQNADGIDKFLQSVGTLSDELAGVSGKLDGTFRAAEGILQSVDPARIQTIITNAESFTAGLRDASQGFDEIVTGIETAVVSVQSSAAKTDATITRANEILNSVDPATVKTVLGNIERTSASADRLVADAAKVTETLGGRAAEIDRFLVDAGTVASDVAKVTTAFSARSGEIDRILMDAGQIASRLNGVSVGVGTAVSTINTIASSTSETVAKVNGVLDSLPPETVRAAVDSFGRATANADKVAADIAKVTEKFGTRAEEIDGIIVDAGELADRLNAASANIGTAVASIAETAGRAGEAIGKVNGVLDGVAPETVRAAVDGFGRAGANADKAAADIARVTEKFGTRAEEIDGIIVDAGELANRLNAASVNVGTAVASINQAAGKASDVFGKANGVLDSVPAETVKSAIANLEGASVNVKKVTDDVAKVTEGIGEGGEVKQILTDAAQLTARLNAASVRVDGILAKVDGLVGSGQAEGVFTEATATLKSFRQVADTLNGRIGAITEGLSRFTGQGLREVEGLVRDGRRSITRIEQAVTDLERNPQRILSGGDGEVRKFNGRPRR